MGNKNLQKVEKNKNDKDIIKNKFFSILLENSSNKEGDTKWMTDNINEWKIIDKNPEWKIIDRNEKTKCCCGHIIKHAFYIFNIKTNKELTVGSTCIKYLDLPKWEEFVKISILLKKLRAAKGQRIEDWKKFFPVKLLLFLYLNGYIVKYIDNTPKMEYEFILKMRRKRKKLTENELKKVNAMIFIKNGILEKLEKNNYLLKEEDFENYLKEEEKSYV
ncbi:MAG: hypothetical protein ACRCUM_03915 [Mycoplasmoidaceae bacterium]